MHKMVDVRARAYVHLKLVDAVVDHERARAQPQSRDGDISGNLRNRVLRLPQRSRHSGNRGAALRCADATLECWTLEGIGAGKESEEEDRAHCELSA